MTFAPIVSYTARPVQEAASAELHEVAMDAIKRAASAAFSGRATMRRGVRPRCPPLGLCTSAGRLSIALGHTPRLQAPNDVPRPAALPCRLQPATLSDRLAIRAGLSLQSSLDLLHHVPRLFLHLLAIGTQHAQERQHPIYTQGDRTKAKEWSLEPE